MWELLEYSLARLGRDPGMGGDNNKINPRLRLVFISLHCLKQAWAVV